MIDFDYVAIRTYNGQTQTTTQHVVLTDPHGLYGLLEYRPRVAPKRQSQLAGLSDVESVADSIVVTVIGDSPSDATRNLERLTGLLRQADDWQDLQQVDAVEIAVRVRDSTIGVLSALIEGTVDGREPLSYDAEFNTPAAPGRWAIQGVELQFVRRGKWLAKDNPVDVDLTSLDGTDEIGSIFSVTGLTTYETPAPIDIFVNEDDVDGWHTHTLIVTNGSDNRPIYFEAEECTGGGAFSTVNDNLAHRGTVAPSVSLGRITVSNDTPVGIQRTFDYTDPQPSMLVPLLAVYPLDDDDVWDLTVRWSSFEPNLLSASGRGNVFGTSKVYGQGTPGDLRKKLIVMEPIPLRPFPVPSPSGKANVAITYKRTSGSGTTAIDTDFVLFVNIARPGTRIINIDPDQNFEHVTSRYYSREPYAQQFFPESVINPDASPEYSRFVTHAGDSDIVLTDDTLNVLVLSFGELAQTNWRPDKASDGTAPATVSVSARIYPAYLTPQ
jgi:hypothetical protein